MKEVIAKTFGGLTKQYYIRQFLFGLIFLSLTVFMETRQESIEILAIVFFIINSLLYPYSRFVYESVIDFIMGDNVFLNSTLMVLIVKSFTMLLCWFFAILIAPIGLAYLYFYHGKKDKEPSE